MDSSRRPEGDAAFFPARERGYLLFPRRQAQRVGGDFHAAFVVVAATGSEFVFQLGLFGGKRVKVGFGVGVGGVDGIEFGLYVFHVAHRFFDDFAHAFVRIELRLLRQVADADARLRPRFALDVGIHACHDFQQGGFARAIQAKDADFGAGEEGEGDVFEDEATAGDDFAHPVHGEYVLAHCFLRWL